MKIRSLILILIACVYKVKDYELIDGDMITIAKIPKWWRMWSVLPELYFPGTYQLSEGLRISDLGDKAKQGLTMMPT